MLVPSRRGFIIGLSSIIATPALVRASSLDAILRSKLILDPHVLTYDYYPGSPSSYAGMRGVHTAVPNEFMPEMNRLGEIFERQAKWVALTEHKKADFLNELIKRKYPGSSTLHEPLWIVKRESEMSTRMLELISRRSNGNTVNNDCNEQ